MSEKAKQKQILLVDDTANVLAVLSDFLKSAAYAVLEAKDAQGAIEVVKEELADLALIDLRMPETDGINLMLSLKKTKPHLPVIIYSGYPSMNTAIEALKKGVDDYIPKPFKLDELSTRIKEALDK
ncbi:MAG: response regulator [Candidatus Aminicenantes bacterium]|nr:MAG: response regulator [Candidatus Aminicenantes bacterium]